MSNPEIKNIDFETLAAIHGRIPEFTPELPSFFAARCQNRPFSAMAAYIGSEPAGYMVCYDRYEDGSLYCWMAGILPDFRQKGAYSALAAAREEWAIENGFSSLRIKTRNSRREMLHWLIKNGFDFMEVDERTPRSDSRIHLIKTLK